MGLAHPEITLTLKQYAAATAAIDSGASVSEVMAIYELSLSEWLRCQNHWAGYLRAHNDHARGTYQETYDRQRADIVQRSRIHRTAPLPSHHVGNASAMAKTAPMTPALLGATPAVGATAPLNLDDVLPLAVQHITPDDTAPMTMPTGIVTGFRFAATHQPPKLPLKTGKWDLAKYALLDEQIESNPGALDSVLQIFGIDFNQYLELRNRFAEAFKLYHKPASRNQYRLAARRPSLHRY